MYKKDTELFLVKFKQNEEGIILSKREIQSQIVPNYKDIISIEEIVSYLGDKVPLSYFKPKQLPDNPIYEAYRIWKEILENENV